MKKITLLAVSASLLLASQSFAAEMRIGYVDIKAAMENTNTYTQGIKRVEALQNKKKKQLEALRKRVTDVEKELQMQSMAMSNEHQAAKQQEFMRLKKEFDRELQDAGEELKGEKRKLDQAMYGKFYDVVRAYGKDKKFDIIIPKSATIFANPAYDITADITKMLDKK